MDSSRFSLPHNRMWRTIFIPMWQEKETKGMRKMKACPKLISKPNLVLNNLALGG